MRIIEIRKIRKMTQEDVMIKSGIKIATFHNMESYIKVPTVLNAIKLANALDVPVEEIFKEEYYKEKVK